MERGRLQIITTPPAGLLSALHRELRTGTALWYVRHGFTNERVTPEEIEVAELAVVVRSDASMIRGTIEGGFLYYAPWGFTRWRLRRAIRAFKRRER